MQEGVRVLVLLPPSEGKASSGRGAPLKLESLSLPGLGEAREAVLRELVELCAGDEDKARDVLGLSEGATEAEIRAAWLRLMRTAHPDGGGSDWLAARVNQAKDVLLGKR